MKTLIVYASRYGYTRECVESLTRQLNGDVTAVDIRKMRVPLVADFDHVILGGSVYMGKVQKKISAFCAKNIDRLKTKPVGLFLSCGLTGDFDANLRLAFPAELIAGAKIATCFGGEIRPDKMGFLMRKMTEMALKEDAKAGRKPMEKLPMNVSKMAEIINQTGV